MIAAVIPSDTGARLSAWTCTAGDGCRGCYEGRIMTHGKGTADELVETHVARIGYRDPVRVHVFESGRGRTFRAWRSHRGIESREVL